VHRACEQRLKDLIRFKGKESPYRFNPKLTAKNGRLFYPAENLYALIEVFRGNTKSKLSCATHDGGNYWMLFPPLIWKVLHAD